jgi:hypothetical protein
MLSIPCADGVSVSVIKDDVEASGSAPLSRSRALAQAYKVWSHQRERDGTKINIASGCNLRYYVELQNLAGSRVGGRMRHEVKRELKSQQPAVFEGRSRYEIGA